jgi:hypothetical protein
VQVGDRGDERETEPGSGGALRLVGPVKTLKDRRHVPWRNARTIVGDRKCDSRRRPFTGDLDSDPGSRMAQRVVDQVGDHLHKQFLVARKRERDVETGDERLAFVLGGRRERLRNLARDLGKVERPERRPPRARLDLADAKQGVEGMEHPLDVADRLADRVAPCA